MTVKRALILILLFISINSLSAGQKKVLFIPVVSEDSMSENAGRFSKMLLRGLRSTEMFDIQEVNDFRFEFQKYTLLLPQLRKAVKEQCGNSSVKTVIFGFIEKKPTFNTITVVMYSPSTGNLLYNYTDYFENESELTAKARQCAVDMGHSVRKSKGSNILLYSAVCPGLGQFFTPKYKFRSAIYFAGFTYSLIKLLSIDKEKDFTPWDSFKLRELGGVPTLTIKGNVVSLSSFYWQLRQNKLAQDHNDKVKDDRKNYFTAVGIIYAINLLDALVSSKTFNDRTVIEKRVNLGIANIGPNKNVASFSLNYNF